MADRSVTYKSYPKAQDLWGKVAVITGASKGIGRAISANLASRGCNVLGTCTSNSSLSFVQELQSEILQLYETTNQSPPRIEGLVLTLNDLNAPVMIADYLQKRFDSRVDIFINNAAAVDRTPVGGLLPELVANMCLCNIQTPAMIIDKLVNLKYFQPRSRIIFISSAESTRCAPEALMYATAEAAGEAMARCYANAFRGRNPGFDFMAGTTANSVLTGLTSTSGPQQFGEQAFAAFKDYWIPRQSVPRLGQPEDVADIVGLLCSDEARWITASKVSANGGSIAIL